MLSSFLFSDPKNIREHPCFWDVFQSDHDAKKRYKKQRTYFFHIFHLVLCILYSQKDRDNTFG